jgi:hypothetical protein
MPLNVQSVFFSTLKKRIFVAARVVVMAMVSPPA